MKKIFLIVLIATIFLLAGCSEQKPSFQEEKIKEIAKTDPDFADFMQKNPDAATIIIQIEKEETGMFEQSIYLKKAEEACGKKFNGKYHGRVFAEKDKKNIEVWINLEDNSIECTIKIQCEENPECVDDNPCTNDICSQGKCENLGIAECKNNDKCCPSSCNYEKDNDCKILHECEENNECDDYDPSTTDFCEGLPRKCLHTLKTCAEQKGQICTGIKQCTSEFTRASDSSQCCPSECLEPACFEVKCANNQKCVNGACILKTCIEMKGVECKGSSFKCGTDLMPVLDTDYCCIGTCTNLLEENTAPQCIDDSNCNDGIIRTTDTCNKTTGKCEHLEMTCELKKGYVCTSTETCPREVIQGVPEMKCCPVPCQPIIYTQTCVDTDNGSWEVAGTTSKAGVTKTDQCYEAGVGYVQTCKGTNCALQEYQCSNNEIYMTEHYNACSPGICFNGACKDWECAKASDCDDGLACTIDSCKNNACEHYPIGYCVSSDNCCITGYVCTNKSSEPLVSEQACKQKYYDGDEITGLVGQGDYDLKPLKIKIKMITVAETGPPILYWITFTLYDLNNNWITDFVGTYYSNAKLMGGPVVSETGTHLQTAFYKNNKYVLYTPIFISEVGIESGTNRGYVVASVVCLEGKSCVNGQCVMVSGTKWRDVDCPA